MELSEVVKRLQKFASTKLAETWDNTGLLIEPSGSHTVKTLLLTNDLTEPVLEEAISMKADMILSYHPPIFQPLKCLVQQSFKQRIVVKCIENRIAVYSPHTAYDTVAGGVNDWLISPFEGRVEPLMVWTSPSVPTGGDYSATVTAPLTLVDSVTCQLEKLANVTVFGSSSVGLHEECRAQIKFNLPEKSLPQLVTTLKQFDGVSETLEIHQLHKPPLPNHGRGRLAVLNSARSIQSCVELVKSHLGLDRVRLALAVGKTMDSDVNSVAVCAGSGSSVLTGVKADLYVTGEMSHHDLLNATHSRTTVILCEHSNTERGFLRTLLAKFHAMFDGHVNVCMSKIDKDPVEIV